MISEQELRQQILDLTEQYYNIKHRKSDTYKEGDKITYASRVYDSDELKNLVDSALDFWLTSGRYAEQFEKEFSLFLGTKYCSLVNSGSSANLLAFMSLTSPKLGERQIKKGDEVITVAAGFPTTINPIIQYGAIPVFIDVTIPSYNIDVSRLTEALSEKTKAIMIAHTLGNPFDLGQVKEFCDKYNLWLIEDNCDALGSKYKYNGEWRYTGTVGDLGTSSFYPPHHITMGEGGAVYTNNIELKRIVDSFRDWGRDCWCNPGVDNTCNKRFSQQFGELPLGYDHKYVYANFGYNLKITDMQAAVGVAQLKKLPEFISSRRKNWEMLRNGLNDLDSVLLLPDENSNSLPSWFGFIITIKETANFTRNEIVAYIESKGIQTRNLFAGNYLKHPCFDEMRALNQGYRIVGELENTDKIMNNSFWIGVYPGITEKMIDYIVKTIKAFIMNKGII